MQNISSTLNIRPVTPGPSHPRPTSRADFANLSQSAAIAEKNTSAYREFETFVLQSFIENMLPDKADGVFGGGFAGQTWKSMMAEKIAGEVAKSGGLGLAEVLARGATPAHGPEGK